jgi:D-alanyl-D-alanine carboxypeptidase/D-alanyl-D-alanine-endopeptidase (penicillin-binding protein 4)
MTLLPTLLMATCLGGLSPLADAGSLPPPITQALRQARIPESALGLVAQPLDAASPEIAHLADEPFNPASVMKIVTTLAALDKFGPAYTWKTAVLAEGDIVAGVLRGNLILRGGGDPALTQERFWALLREARARGIVEIQGDVIIDNGFYGIDPPDPAEFDQTPLKSYNANPAALLLNYNAVALRLSPEDGRLAARLDPPGLPVAVAAHLEHGTACGDLDDSLDIRRDGDSLRVAGAYPVACGARQLWLNLMCPAATSASWFKSIWAELGGRHTGQMRLGTTPGNARLLFEHDSPPLSLIVRDTNKFSNNVMAKMLLLNLGAARHGAPATWEKGRAAIQEWLAEKGLAIPELVLENGSGLSREERLSPSSTARLLVWAARQPLYYDFAASLPSLGQDGTVRRRYAASPWAGRAWLKSGSLNGVRNLAGYYLDAAGRRHALVMFLRHSNAAQAAQAQGAILDWLLGRDGVAR